jgi:hypothetical protein
LQRFIPEREREHNSTISQTPTSIRSDNITLIYGVCMCSANSTDVHLIHFGIFVNQNSDGRLWRKSIFRCLQQTREHNGVIKPLIERLRLRESDLLSIRRVAICNDDGPVLHHERCWVNICLAGNRSSIACNWDVVAKCPRSGKAF